MNDISDFPKYSIVKSHSGAIYEVVRYNKRKVTKLRNRKSQIIDGFSTLRNIETNIEITAAHGKNKCFELVKNR